MICFGGLLVFAKDYFWHLISWLFSLIVQVLKAKVLQCDPDKAKLMLSFKATVEGDTEAPKPQLDCEVGKVS